MSDAESDCVRLREFRDFLTSLETAEIEEIKIVSRNNDTYPITMDELCAEIQAIVWAQCTIMRCPPHFRIALARAATEAAKKQCVTRKEYHTDAVNGDANAEQSTPEMFDLVKLRKFVVNVLEQLVTRLTDNSEAANLADYADKDMLCKGKCTCATTATQTAAPDKPPLSAFVGYIKNKPRKMEDRYLCLDRYSELYDLSLPYSLYGVFDGHSGPLAATYVAAQLPYLMAERLRSISATDESESSFCEAFESAFLHADRMFGAKQLSGGTTAVSALLLHSNPRRLFVAWVGDSKALLVSPTASLQLVKPHKPDSLDERKRIAEAGASVMFVHGHWRVNGILNVARSIGDNAVRAVIAEPDFVDVQLTDDHDFMILGTDGLWDFADESIVVQTAYEAFANAELRLEDIPKLLIDLAKRGDSQDNITVIIVLLKARAEIVASFKR